MRDGINDNEARQMHEALKEGAPWEAVRSMHRDVDPVAMDRNFKEWCFRKAGIEMPAPTEAEVAALKAKADAEKAKAEDAKLAEMLEADAAEKAAKKASKKTNPLE